MSNWPNNMTKPHFQPGTFTTGQAAKILGVSLRTVQLWVADGKLHSRQTPGGHRRISHAALSALAESMGRPMPDAPPVRCPEAVAMLLVTADGVQAVELLRAGDRLPAGNYTLFLGGES
jgi:excisionase family DNA binding protein